MMSRSNSSPLRHPQTISLALTMEPVIGSFIGWAAGLSAPPGVASLLGGAMLMVAVVTGDAAYDALLHRHNFHLFELARPNIPLRHPI
jgi:hypothetical protein